MNSITVRLKRNKETATPIKQIFKKQNKKRKKKKEKLIRKSKIRRSAALREVTTDLCTMFRGHLIIGTCQHTAQIHNDNYIPGFPKIINASKIHKNSRL